MHDVHLARPYPEPGFRFQLFESYRTLAGEWTRVVEVNDSTRGYETVRCNDSPDAELGWRYNRTTQDSDMGRCTGTAHDFSDPRNLIPWAPRMRFHLSYRSGLVTTIRAHSLKDAMQQAEYRCTAMRQEASILDVDTYKVLADVHYGGGVRNAEGEFAFLAIARKDAA